MESNNIGVMTYSEYSNVEYALMEVAYLMVEGGIFDSNGLNEASFASAFGKTGFKITKSKGILSLLASASKGMGLLMVAAMKGDREEVARLSKSVKREDVINLLLKMDKVSLGIVSAPLGLISEITGWNLELNMHPDTNPLVNSIDFVIDHLKGVIDNNKIKRYTSVFNKLKAELNMKNLKEWTESINEGLRGENFYYEWDLMNKTHESAITALKGQGFEEYGSGGTWRNSKTKELADIRQTSSGYKIDISDSHGKRMA